MIGRILRSREHGGNIVILTDRINIRTKFRCKDLTKNTIVYYTIEELVDYWQLTEEVDEVVRLLYGAK